MEPLEELKNDEPQKDCEDFDEILDIIGSSGRFQKILLYAVLCPIVTIYPFSELSPVFMWDIPDHYCNVPGRPDNVSIETWKNLTLPWEVGPDGNLRHSQCKMYTAEGDDNTSTSCEHGWIYDKTDYDNTIPSQFDWVCDHDHYVTECFTYGSFGSAVGSVIFGILADKYGRRPIFFVAAAANLIIRTSSLFFAYDFNMYKVLQLFSALTLSPVFNMPVLICGEMSGTEYRSWIFAATWMIWVLGNSIIPFVAMLCRDWFILGCVSGIPAFLILLAFPFVPESPRWLVTSGHDKSAVKVILKMAKINGKSVSKCQVQEMVTQVYSKIKKSEENGRPGVWTLFSKRRLAGNTALLIVAFSMNSLLYYGLTLNTTHMAGNRFLNYFYLSLIELPGGWMAGKLVEKTGRRWTQAGFFLVCAFFCLICAVAVSYPGYGTVVILAALGIKFGVSVTSLVAYLQSTEIFPTQLRSTGGGFVGTMATTVGIIGPYIVYTGSSHVSLPYALLCGVSMLGAAGSVCLPETFQQHLPETIDDANGFGKSHKFWSYLPTNNTERKKNGSKNVK